MIILRISLFTIFILNDLKDTFLRDTAIVITNIAIFSFIDGFGNGSLFVLASEEILLDNEKELSGFIMALALNFGIMLGSILALPFSYINN